MRRFTYALIVTLLVSILAAVPAQADDLKSCQRIEDPQNRQQCMQSDTFTIYSNAVNAGLVADPVLLLLA